MGRFECRRDWDRCHAIAALLATVTPFTIPDGADISSAVDASQSVLTSASCNSFLWQIQQFRDNMQRLAILTFLAITAAGWMAIQQQRLAAFQTEPQSGQSVEATGEDPASGESPSQNAADGESAAGPTDVSAQTAPKPPPPPDPAIVAAAEKLLRDARDRLYATKSVRARFVERANIGARRFAGEGTYLSGVFPALKLQYRVQIGDSEGELVEVCDGNVLRTSKVIRPIDGDSDEPTFSQWTRKDIAKILTASHQEGTPEAAVLQAELSLGGVPTLLASIEQTMIFDTFREQIWKGRPTTVIEGRWRPDILAQFSQQMGAAAQSMAQLRPDRVRLYIDKDTLFPNRILYRKLASRDPEFYVTLMSIEFDDVQLDQGVGPEEFRYLPPQGVDEIDETALYLQMIESMRAESQPSAAAGGQPVDRSGAAVPNATPQSPAVSPTP